MDTWKVSWRDKDSGELKELEVPGWADLALKSNELREDGHDAISWRRSRNGLHAPLCGGCSCSCHN
jgi:hypothetical protein